MLCLLCAASAYNSVQLNITRCMLILFFAHKGVVATLQVQP